MADTMTAEKRAQDIVDKYHKRMDDWSKMITPDSVDEHNAIMGELKADIANAINAVVNEFTVKMAEMDFAMKAAEAKAKAAASPETMVKMRPAVTHMPATGSHAKGK